MFYLITPSRTFTFMGSDPDEKEGWMRDLNKCIASSSVASLSQAQKRIEVTILGSEVDDCILLFFVLGSQLVVQVRQENKKSFTAYKLLVENEQAGVSKEIWRRYSEFDTLKKKIKKAFPRFVSLLVAFLLMCFSETFANLPRKHLVGNLNNDVIEARRIMLERYLQENIMNPRVLSSDLVLAFLGL